MFNLLMIIVLVAFDQILKFAATNALSGGATAVIIPHVLGLKYVLNPGAGFSILSGKVNFLIVITTVAMAVIAFGIFTKKFQNKFEEFCFVLILAGGIGNLIDRVMNGVVVDYLEFLFMDFPIFNFADILICVGVGLFIAYTVYTEFLHKDKRDK